MKDWEEPRRPKRPPRKSRTDIFKSLDEALADARLRRTPEGQRLIDDLSSETSPYVRMLHDGELDILRRHLVYGQSVASIAALHGLSVQKIKREVMLPAYVRYISHSSSRLKPFVRSSGEVIWVRSEWERDFATMLDGMSLEFDYEPETFTVGKHEYTPDFFVRTPLGECFVELHPMEEYAERYGASAKTIRAAVEAIPLKVGVPLVVLDVPEIAEMREFLKTKPKTTVSRW